MPAIRPLHCELLISVFERDGFQFNRQEGDHKIYVKAGVRRPLVIFKNLERLLRMLANWRPVCLESRRSVSSTFITLLSRRG